MLILKEEQRNKAKEQQRPCKGIKQHQNETDAVFFPVAVLCEHTGLSLITVTSISEMSSNAALCQRLPPINGYDT